MIGYEKTARIRPLLRSRPEEKVLKKLKSRTISYFKFHPNWSSRNGVIELLTSKLPHFSKRILVPDENLEILRFWLKKNTVYKSINQKLPSF